MLVLALLASGATFSPTRISYTELRNGGASATLADALSSHGIIAVTNIPGFAAGRKTVLAHAASCATFEQSQTFQDGTIRKTIATQTIAGPGGAQPFKSGTSAACAAFTKEVEPFRAAVDEATRVFSRRVSDLLQIESPLLVARDDAHPFEDFFAVADNGVHLEHIHAYTPPADHRPAAPRAPTLETHTDQGLFIAFTPAYVPSSSSDDDDASAFFVTLPDGTTARASFDANALVFMIGAGLEQLAASKPATTTPRFLPRAMPHALTVAGSAAHARMWYGRMVLPPARATVPGTGSTYGEVREALHQAAVRSSPGDASTAKQSDDLVSLGCGTGASDDPLGVLHRRVLSESASCAAGTLLCWHRCMALEVGNAQGVSATDCAARNLMTQCVNPMDQVGPGRHGDFYPACTNSTKPVTPLPKLATSPRADACAAEADFLAHADAAYLDGDYDHALNLTAMCGAVRYGPNKSPGYPCVRGQFLWKREDGIVRAKMIGNGLFGWLAIGLENPGGAHNGMNGGRIVMALPASPATFSAATGLDMAADPTPSVLEYVINEVGGSAFRFWSTPHAPSGVTGASVEASDCYTSMTFSTSTIAGWSLNMSGTDSLIWGLNDMDAFVGYHGSHNRGKLVVDWTAPKPSDGRIPDETVVLAAAGSAVALLLVLLVVVGLVLRCKGPADAAGTTTTTTTAVEVGGNGKPAGTPEDNTTPDNSVSNGEVDVQVSKA